MLEDIEQALIQFKNDIPFLSRKVASKIIPRFSKEVENIFEEAVAEYYAAYSPKYYSRMFSLLNAYKITCTTTSIVLESDATMIPDVHRVSPEYIFDYMFSKGYHGGANKGKGHPKPGTLLYRSPVPGFGNPPYSRWSGAANQSESPEKKIDEKFDDFFNSKEAAAIVSDEIMAVLKTYMIFNI